jgi:hypothetical protein
LAAYDIGAYEAQLRASYTVDPQVLDFGAWEVRNGPSGPLTTLFLNTGFSDIEINPSGVVIIGADAGDFSTSNTLYPGFQLAPGGSSIISVTFDPSSIGAKEAQMIIWTTDYLNPFITVTLRGRGEENSTAVRPQAWRRYK